MVNAEKLGMLREIAGVVLFACPFRHSAAGRPLSVALKSLIRRSPDNNSDAHACEFARRCKRIPDTHRRGTRSDFSRHAGSSPATPA